MAGGEKKNKKKGSTLHPALAILSTKRIPSREDEKHPNAMELWGCFIPQTQGNKEKIPNPKARKTREFHRLAWTPRPTTRLGRK
jgi:hypothetical protein